MTKIKKEEESYDPSRKGLYGVTLEEQYRFIIIFLGSLSCFIMLVIWCLCCKIKQQISEQ